MREKYVKTSKLQMSYEISGPEDGQPVILLHGWPDCVRTWDEVLPHLHNSGYQTFVPSLLGFGHTTFLDDNARRTGGPLAFATDIKEFIEALDLTSVRIIGQDWGAFTAMTLASLYGTDLVKSEVVFSEGWQMFSRMSLKQIKEYWYQWYMTTDQGAEYVRKRQSEFALFMWKEWSPRFTMTAQKAQTLTSFFQNEDWAEVTLDTYRQRWGVNPFDEEYSEMDRQLKKSAQILVPTLNIIGKEDSCTDYKSATQISEYFEGPFDQQFWDEAGHFIQREKPRDISYAAADWFDKY